MTTLTQSRLQAARNHNTMLIAEVNAFVKSGEFEVYSTGSESYWEGDEDHKVGHMVQIHRPELLTHMKCHALVEWKHVVGHVIRCPNVGQFRTSKD